MRVREKSEQGSIAQCQVGMRARAADGMPEGELDDAGRRLRAEGRGCNTVRMPENRANLAWWGILCLLFAVQTPWQV